MVWEIMAAGALAKTIETPAPSEPHVPRNSGVRWTEPGLVKTRDHEALPERDTPDAESARLEVGEARTNTHGLERACYVLQLVARSSTPAPAFESNGRTVVIASSRPEERFLFEEHAHSRGSTVTKPPFMDALLPLALNPTVVLVVVRPEEADLGLEICQRLRSARYERAFCYLPASDSRNEREAAEAAGATVIDAKPGDPRLFQEFSECLDDAIKRYPPRVRFLTLEIDLDSHQLRIEPNGKGKPIVRSLSRALVPALTLLVERGAAGALGDELCAVSNITPYESAPRKLIGRLKQLIGTDAGVAIEKCGPARYRLVPTR